MAFIPQMFSLISLVFFVAVFNLSYSFILRNGEPTQDENTTISPSYSFTSTDLRINLTDLVAGDPDLRNELLNKLIKLLEKEEAVFDLERQKLELEIELLKQELNKNGTRFESFNQSETNAALQGGTPILNPEGNSSTELTTEDYSTSTSPDAALSSTSEPTPTDAAVSTTSEPTSTEATVSTTMIVVDDMGSTSFAYLKSASEPTKNSAAALAISLIVAVFVLQS